MSGHRRPDGRAQLAFGPPIITASFLTLRPLVQSGTDPNPRFATFALRFTEPAALIGAAVLGALADYSKMSLDVTIWLPKAMAKSATPSPVTSP